MKFRYILQGIQYRGLSRNCRSSSSEAMLIFVVNCLLVDKNGFRDWQGKRLASRKSNCSVEKFDFNYM